MLYSAHDPRRYGLAAELMDDVYYGLLDFALGECSVAVLHTYCGQPAEKRRVFRQLEPFLLRIEPIGEWPGSAYITDPVHFYEYVPTSAEIIRRATNRLYDWGGDLPDDLCLLRADESPFLLTLAHHQESSLTLSSEEKDRLLTFLPAIAPYLISSHDWPCAHEKAMEIGRLLCEWDPYDYFGDPYQDCPGESLAVYFALTSGQGATEETLAHFIADMFTRWHEYQTPLTDADCPPVARTILEWWKQQTP